MFGHLRFLTFHAFFLFHLEFYRPNEDINPLSNWLLYNFAFGFSKLRWKLLYVLSRACWVITYYGEESDDFIFSPRRYHRITFVRYHGLNRWNLLSGADFIYSLHLQCFPVRFLHIYLCQGETVRDKNPTHVLK